MSLLDPLFRWEAIEACFSDHARLQAMLEFEAGLARAEARTGVIPANAMPEIVEKCRAELFDTNALAAATAVAGNPAIPLVKKLTELVGIDSKQAAGFVHWGATSQDVIDTGFVLQLRSALRKLDVELQTLSDALAQLVQKHRGTILAGRTLLQQGSPTTFGLKAAGWLDAIDRHRVRFTEVQKRAIVLQFGGAVGNLAALGDKGVAVAAALGEELRLPVPAIPWHSNRDSFAEIATTLGLCTGTLGKIARDISLHAQTELAEVFEPAGQGRGGSSTMPQKRNPVTSVVVLAAATRVPPLVSSMLTAMVQEHERGAGGWHAEWEVMPELVGITGGALHHLTATVSGLEIDAGQMRTNLEVTHGLIFAEAVQMALAKKVGRMAAHELVAAAIGRAQKEHLSLRQVLEKDSEVTKHLKKRELEQLFDPRRYLGASDKLIDRVLKAHSAQASRAVRESE